MKVLTISPAAPYDFELSLRVTRSFAPGPSPEPSVLRTAVRIEEQPLLLELRQVCRAPPLVEIRTAPLVNGAQARRIAEWVLCAGLDLQPFYRIAFAHSALGPLVEELHGLKPMRPASLFEMLIIAVTEQQISMAAAYRIRKRLVEHYGEPVDGLWVFPTALRLSATTIAELMKCGLSHRKAEYVRGLAERVAGGQLDLGRLPALPDAEVRDLLLKERGLGPWSADYILVRGLSRPDCVPADDLGLRTIVGHYLGRGQRLTAQGTLRKLAPFAPYRGLAAFYLLAYWRLSQWQPVDRP